MQPQMNTDEHGSAQPQPKLGHSLRLRVFVVKAGPNPPRRHEDAKKLVRLTWGRSICKSIASSVLTVAALTLAGCDNLSKEQLREIAQVKRPIEQDPALVNKIDAAGQTPLHVAVINNY